jgi:hypothetical protein
MANQHGGQKGGDRSGDLFGELPPDAPPADLYAALRRDIEGLTELSRWQWNLIQRVRDRLDRLPADWPADGS